MKAKLILLLLFVGFLTIFACTNQFIEKVLQIEEETPTPTILEETPSLPIPPAVTVNHTVTFNSGGGSAVLSQTVTEGGTATRPANPTRTGNNFDSYVFDNWYAETGMIAEFDFSTPIIKNTTLHAKWNLVSQTGHNLLWIPAGTFTMGSPTTEPDRQSYGTDETQHQVTLTKGFYMGKYQVTQAQYEAVMGTNPSSFYVAVSPETSTANRPVDCVSWYAALMFCNKLSISEGLNPAYQINGNTNPGAWGNVPTDDNAIWNAVIIVAGSNGYRLPTEAQWEYACRAGTWGDNYSMFNWGTNTIDSTRANYAYVYPLDRTTRVGSYDPNAWGLYDMHGNVGEWCWDRYGNYPKETQTDPTGPASGNERITRGGSWGSGSKYLRSAYRNTISSSFYKDGGIGFRVVRVVGSE